jgi:hypothetical protein
MRESDAMKVSARIMLDFIKFSILTLGMLMLALGGRSEAGQKKEAPPRVSSDSPETYKIHCMKKRKDEKRCNTMVELLKNLEDAKKPQIVDK